LSNGLARTMFATRPQGFARCSVSAVSQGKLLLARFDRGAPTHRPIPNPRPLRLRPVELGKSSGQSRAIPTEEDVDGKGYQRQRDQRTGPKLREKLNAYPATTASAISNNPSDARARACDCAYFSYSLGPPSKLRSSREAMFVRIRPSVPAQPLTLATCRGATKAPSSDQSSATTPDEADSDRIAPTVHAADSDQHDAGNDAQRQHQAFAPRRRAARAEKPSEYSSLRARMPVGWLHRVILRLKWTQSGCRCSAPDERSWRDRGTPRTSAKMRP
jgi:hypothetical protein